MKKSNSRRKFTPEFKAKVAIAAIKEELTLSALADQYGVHANLIAHWKREFLDRSSEIFAKPAVKDQDHTEEERRLYEKIGRLEVEVDFCRRAYEKLGMPLPEKK